MVDEVVDTQIVDIDIIGDALTREILAEIRAVGANGLGQLLQGEVVLQVKLRVDATLGQQSLDLGDVDIAKGLNPFLIGEGSSRRCL